MAIAKHTSCRQIPTGSISAANGHAQQASHRRGPARHEEYGPRRPARKEDVSRAVAAARQPRPGTWPRMSTRSALYLGDRHGLREG